MATTFLTTQERQQYVSIPSEISQRETIQYFTLTLDDLAAINQGRNKTIQFGFATQLCLLRWLGRFPDDLTLTPTSALQFLSEQLRLPASLLDQYPTRGRIGRVHRERIRRHFWYKDFSRSRVKVKKWLLPLALEHDFVHKLLDALIDHLRRQKIIRPGISHLERLVTEVRDEADDHTLKIIKRMVLDRRFGREGIQLSRLVGGQEFVEQFPQVRFRPSAHFSDEPFDKGDAGADDMFAAQVIESRLY